MSQHFSLSLDTTAPQSSSITVLDYYKNNLTPITISSTGASFMKVWIDQTASPESVPGTLTWKAYAASWTPNFSVEGTNYVHAVFMDSVGNTTSIINSTATIFDKTLPTTSDVKINNGATITTSRDVTVRVTASDNTGGSGIGKVEFTGNLHAEDETHPRTFNWSDEDRAAGYKDCALTIYTLEDERYNATINAHVSDRAGNYAEVKSATITYYSGSGSAVISLKDSTDTKTLEAYTNEVAFSLDLNATVADVSTIIGYKVWGDFAETSGGSATEEPADYTTWPASQTKVALARYLTAAQGLKTIKAKLKVSSEGSEVEQVLDDATVTLDTVAPTVVLTAEGSVISEQTGHNEVQLGATISDTNHSNVAKVVAYSSQEAAQAGSHSDASNLGLYDTSDRTTTYNPKVLAANLIAAIPGEGIRYFVAYIRDVAGNWGKSNIITITTDLTAPVGTIAVDSYYNATKGFVASAADSGSSVSKMTAWVDASATTAEPPASATENNYQATTASDTGFFDWTGKVQGTNYVHIQYKDIVGNKAITTSSSFVYDTEAPTGCSVTAPARTNTATISITLAATDTVSGMGKMKIYGDVSGAATAETAVWEDYAATKSITLSGADGTKTINVLFKDNAENVIANAVTTTTVLDTGTAAATLVLRKADDSENLPNYTNTRDFAARVGSNDETETLSQYKMWGDIGDAAVAEADAEWKDFTPDEGKTYMTIRNLQFTTGDATKSVSVKVKDTAGNISAAATQTAILDTTAPVVDVSSVDYQIVSKLHTARLNNEGAVITGAYNDMMTFKFTPDSDIVEWKVCVWDTDQTAAGATAIGSTYGSINMTGTTSTASTAINCTIMGKDFAATSKVADTDGAYVVIVYVKDSAGNWSAIYVPTI